MAKDTKKPDEPLTPKELAALEAKERTELQNAAGAAGDMSELLGRAIENNKEVDSDGLDEAPDTQAFKLDSGFPLESWADSENSRNQLRALFQKMGKGAYKKVAHVVQPGYEAYTEWKRERLDSQSEQVDVFDVRFRHAEQERTRNREAIDTALEFSESQLHDHIEQFNTTNAELEATDWRARLSEARKGVEHFTGDIQKVTADIEQEQFDEQIALVQEVLDVARTVEQEAGVDGQSSLVTYIEQDFEKQLDVAQQAHEDAVLNKSDLLEIKKASIQANRQVTHIVARTLKEAGSIINKYDSSAEKTEAQAGLEEKTRELVKSRSSEHGTLQEYKRVTAQLDYIIDECKKNNQMGLIEQFGLLDAQQALALEQGEKPEEVNTGLLEQRLNYGVTKDATLKQNIDTLLSMLRTGDLVDALAPSPENVDLTSPVEKLDELKGTLAEQGLELRFKRVLADLERVVQQGRIDTLSKSDDDIIADVDDILASWETIKENAEVAYSDEELESLAGAGLGAVTILLKLKALKEREGATGGVNRENVLQVFEEHNTELAAAHESLAEIQEEILATQQEIIVVATDHIEEYSRIEHVTHINITSPYTKLKHSKDGAETGLYLEQSGATLEKAIGAAKISEAHEERTRHAEQRLVAAHELRKRAQASRESRSAPVEEAEKTNLDKAYESAEKLYEKTEELALLTKASERASTDGYRKEFHEREGKEKYEAAVEEIKQGMRELFTEGEIDVNDLINGIKGVFEQTMAPYKEQAVMGERGMETLLVAHMLSFREKVIKGINVICTDTTATYDTVKEFLDGGEITSLNEQRDDARHSVHHAIEDTLGGIDKKSELGRNLRYLEKEVSRIKKLNPREARLSIMELKDLIEDITTVEQYDSEGTYTGDFEHEQLRGVLTTRLDDLLNTYALEHVNTLAQEVADQWSIDQPFVNVDIEQRTAMAKEIDMRRLRCMALLDNGGASEDLPDELRFAAELCASAGVVAASQRDTATAAHEALGTVGLENVSGDDFRKLRVFGFNSTEVNIAELQKIGKKGQNDVRVKLLERASEALRDPRSTKGKLAGLSGAGLVGLTVFGGALADMLTPEEAAAEDKKPTAQEIAKTEHEQYGDFAERLQELHARGETLPTREELKENAWNALWDVYMKYRGGKGAPINPDYNVDFTLGQIEKDKIWPDLAKHYPDSKIQEFVDELDPDGSKGLSVEWYRNDPGMVLDWGMREIERVLAEHEEIIKNSTDIRIIALPAELKDDLAVMSAGLDRTFGQRVITNKEDYSANKWDRALDRTFDFIEKVNPVVFNMNTPEEIDQIKATVRAEVPQMIKDIMTEAEQEGNTFTWRGKQLAKDDIAQLAIDRTVVKYFFFPGEGPTKPNVFDTPLDVPGDDGVPEEEIIDRPTYTPEKIPPLKPLQKVPGEEHGEPEPEQIVNFTVEISQLVDELMEIRSENFDEQRTLDNAEIDWYEETQIRDVLGPLKDLPEEVNKALKTLEEAQEIFNDAKGAVKETLDEVHVRYGQQIEKHQQELEDSESKWKPTLEEFGEEVPQDVKDAFDQLINGSFEGPLDLGKLQESVQNCLSKINEHGSDMVKGLAGKLHNKATGFAAEMTHAVQNELQAKRDYITNTIRTYEQQLQEMANSGDASASGLMDTVKGLEQQFNDAISRIASNKEATDTWFAQAVLQAGVEELDNMFKEIAEKHGTETDDGNMLRYKNEVQGSVQAQIKMLEDSGNTTCVEYAQLKMLDALLQTSDLEIDEDGNLKLGSIALTEGGLKTAITNFALTFTEDGSQISGDRLWVNINKEEGGFGDMDAERRAFERMGSEIKNFFFEFDKQGFLERGDFDGAQQYFNEWKVNVLKTNIDDDDEFGGKLIHTTGMTIKNIENQLGIWFKDPEVKYTQNADGTKTLHKISFEEIHNFQEELGNDVKKWIAGRGLGVVGTGEDRDITKEGQIFGENVWFNPEEMMKQNMTEDGEVNNDYPLWMAQGLVVGFQNFAFAETPEGDPDKKDFFIDYRVNDDGTFVVDEAYARQASVWMENLRSRIVDLSFKRSETDPNSKEYAWLTMEIEVMRDVGENVDNFIAKVTDGYVFEDEDGIQKFTASLFQIGQGEHMDESMVHYRVSDLDDGEQRVVRVDPTAPDPETGLSDIDGEFDWTAGVRGIRIETLIDPETGEKLYKNIDEGHKGHADKAFFDFQKEQSYAELNNIDWKSENGEITELSIADGYAQVKDILTGSFNDYEKSLKDRANEDGSIDIVKEQAVGKAQLTFIEQNLEAVLVTAKHMIARDKETGVIREESFYAELFEVVLNGGTEQQVRAYLTQLDGGYDQEHARLNMGSLGLDMPGITIENIGIANRADYGGNKAEGGIDSSRVAFDNYLEFTWGTEYELNFNEQGETPELSITINSPLGGEIPAFSLYIKGGESLTGNEMESIVERIQNGEIRSVKSLSSALQEATGIHSKEDLYADDNADIRVTFGLQQLKDLVSVGDQAPKQMHLMYKGLEWLDAMSKDQAFDKEVVFNMDDILHMEEFEDQLSLNDENLEDFLVNQRVENLSADEKAKLVAEFGEENFDQGIKQNVSKEVSGMTEEEKGALIRSENMKGKINMVQMIAGRAVYGEEGGFEDLQKKTAGTATQGMQEAYRALLEDMIDTDLFGDYLAGGATYGFDVKHTNERIEGTHVDTQAQTTQIGAAARLGETTAIGAEVRYQKLDFSGEIVEGSPLEAQAVMDRVSGSMHLEFQVGDNITVSAAVQGSIENHIRNLKMVADLGEKNGAENVMYTVPLTQEGKDVLDKNGLKLDAVMIGVSADDIEITGDGKLVIKHMSVRAMPKPVVEQMNAEGVKLGMALGTEVDAEVQYGNIGGIISKDMTGNWEFGVAGELGDFTAKAVVGGIGGPNLRPGMSLSTTASLAASLGYNVDVLGQNTQITANFGNNESGKFFNIGTEISLTKTGKAGDSAKDRLNKEVKRIMKESGQSVFDK